MKNYTERNRALLHFIVTPTILLTVALLGGLRVDAQTRQFIFIAPPLVTLVLAMLLGSLFVRAGAIDLRQWLALEQPMLTNLAHLLTLLALFFASAQAINSVQHGVCAQALVGLRALCSLRQLAKDDCRCAVARRRHRRSGVCSCDWLHLLRRVGTLCRGFATHCPGSYATGSVRID